ncbi:MAG: hypothetical protein QHH06_12230 [Clostridiales bacterium]|nr:hypothetical protein [Eubacteriales bacterium]MDH7567220.1 hypothetical protein [Clostridiales bacterium]
MSKELDTQSTKDLLLALDDEIDQKCFELKEKKKAERLKKVFFYVCILVITLPFISIFTGFSLWSFLLPMVVFQGLSLILLVSGILNLDKEAV